MVNLKALGQAQQLTEKLALDIAQRQGLHNWWEDIKPEVKEGIKRDWRRIIYKELTKGTV